MPRSGDTVTIEAPSGQPLRLRVASTVYDPSLAPSLQEITATATCRRHRWPAGHLGPAGPAGPAEDPGRRPGAGEAEGGPRRGVAVAGDVGQCCSGTAAWRSVRSKCPSPTIPQIGILKAIGARSGRIARTGLRSRATKSAKRSMTHLPLRPVRHCHFAADDSRLRVLTRVLGHPGRRLPHPEPSIWRTREPSTTQQRQVAPSPGSRCSRGARDRAALVANAVVRPPGGEDMNACRRPDGASVDSRFRPALRGTAPRSGSG